MIHSLILGWLKGNATRVLGWTFFSLAIIGVLLGARNAGVQAERLHNIKRREAARRKADEVKDDVRALPDGAALGELRDDWSRRR